MNDLSTDAEAGMESAPGPSLGKAQDHSTPRPLGGSGLAETLFEQATLAMEAQRISLKLGRQQMARDVLAWAARNSAALAGAPVESLLALCNRELQP